MQKAAVSVETQCLDFGGKPWSSRVGQSSSSDFGEVHFLPGPRGSRAMAGSLLESGTNRNVSVEMGTRRERTCLRTRVEREPQINIHRGSKPAEPQARRLLAGLLFPLSDPVLRRHQSTGVTSASQFAWDVPRFISKSPAYCSLG